MITPAFQLDWTNGTSLPSVDVVRAGVATYVDSAGIIALANADTQRVDWRTGVAGLLVEESRINLALQSEDFSSASWGKARSSVSANAITSPDGTLNADKLIEDSTASNTHFVFQAPALSSSTDYTWSVFAKAAERTKVGVIFADRAGVLRGRVFDLSNGTSSAAPAGFSAPISFDMQEFDDSWYRCIVTANSAIGAGSFPCRVYVADASGNLSYTGNGSSGVFVYGGQCEAGAFATSYIPTTTTAVTRNADVATITGTNFSDFWQASKGGAQVQAIPSTVSGVRPLVQFDDGTADNIIALRGNAANPELQIVDGGALQVQLDAGTIVANTPYSLTGWWQTNDCKARQNSGATVSDYTASIPTVTQARLGSDGTNYLNGHLATINYYDRFTGQIYDRRKNKAVFSLL